MRIAGMPVAYIAATFILPAVVLLGSIDAFKLAAESGDPTPVTAESIYADGFPKEQYVSLEGVIREGEIAHPHPSGDERLTTYFVPVVPQSAPETEGIRIVAIIHDARLIEEFHAEEDAWVGVLESIEPDVEAQIAPWLGPDAVPHLDVPVRTFVYQGDPNKRLYSALLIAFGAWLVAFGIAFIGRDGWAKDPEEGVMPGGGDA